MVRTVASSMQAADCTPNEQIAAALLTRLPAAVTPSWMRTTASRVDARIAPSSSHRKVRNRWRLPRPMALPTCEHGCRGAASENCVCCLQLCTADYVGQWPPLFQIALAALPACNGPQRAGIGLPTSTPAGLRTAPNSCSPPSMAHPRAVVVKHFDAAVGHGAVLGAQRPHNAARYTQLAPLPCRKRWVVQHRPAAASRAAAAAPLLPLAAAAVPPLHLDAAALAAAAAAAAGGAAAIERNEAWVCAGCEVQEVEAGKGQGKCQPHGRNVGLQGAGSRGAEGGCKVEVQVAAACARARGQLGTPAGHAMCSRAHRWVCRQRI